MILFLDEVKEWLRIDTDADDVTLQTLIFVAEKYLFNATGKTFDTNNHEARLLCLVLIADWYENRELIGKDSNVRYAIRSLLTQLQYGSDDNESS